MSGYLLDTNVISEIGSAAQDSVITAWLNSVDASQFRTATIVIEELLYGIARLPEGTRKERLKIWFGHIESKFAGRIFSFDESAARIWGDLKARLERQGQTRPLIDLQIAAIALHHRLAVVTRNTKHFEGLGLTLINPWTHQV